MKSHLDFVINQHTTDNMINKKYLDFTPDYLVVILLMRIYLKIGTKYIKYIMFIQLLVRLFIEMETLKLKFYLTKNVMNVQ